MFYEEEFIMYGVTIIIIVDEIIFRLLGVFRVKASMPVA